MPVISVVICASDDSRFRRASDMYARTFPAGALEILRIKDAQCPAEGCNRALAAARGNYVVFTDPDVELLAPDLWEKLQEHMRHCDILGIAGTRLLTAPGWRMAGPPHLYGQIASPARDSPAEFTVTFWTVPSRRADHMQALDGGFICAARDVARRIGFDPLGFPGSHLHDVDFTYRAHLAGLHLSVALDLFPLDHSPDAYSRDWIPHAQTFLKKFDGRLPVRASPKFQNTTVQVASREEVVRVMTPPHWQDATSPPTK